MDNSKSIKYTASGYKALVDELDYLKQIKIEEVKKAIAQARSFGDLSENSEYDEAKNEQAKVVARIAELEELIQNAVIVEESDMKVGVVNLGFTVRVYDFDMEEEVEYSIVGTNEANPLMGRISDRSPIGSALIGAKVGDEVEVDTPAGTIKFKILSVERTDN